MNRNWLALATAVGLSACSQGSDGIWYVTLPLLVEECVTTIDENITDAQVPDEFVDEEWIVTDDTTVSDGTFFIQIIESRSDQAFLVMGNEIFPGTVEKDTMTFTWPSFVDDSHAETHADSGYTYSDRLESTVTTTISLALNKDTKNMEGTWENKRDTTSEFSEIDEWAPDGPYIYTGQINAQILGWLVGTASNEPDTEDCDTDPCFVNVVEACSASTSFSAVYTELREEGAYEALEDAEQNPGV